MIAKQDSIKSQSEWWNALDKNWEEIKTIIYHFLPVNEKRNFHNEDDSLTMAEVIEQLKQNKQAEVAIYLNETWAVAPDNPEIHEFPKWLTLCELCSESHYLYEEEHEKS